MSFNSGDSRDIPDVRLAGSTFAMPHPHPQGEGVSSPFESAHDGCGEFIKGTPFYRPASSSLTGSGAHALDGRRYICEIIES